MTQLYLDSAAIIYAVEANPEFSGQTIRRIVEHLQDEDARLLTSRLSRLECRVRPLRDDNQAVLADYEDFFAADRLQLIDVSAAIVERATSLRAQYGFQTGDAVHLATAIEHNVEVVLTGDSAWHRCPDVQVEILTAESE